MDSGRTHIEIRRPWHEGESIFLLGPGGVGKSTLGRVLSRCLGWPLIDLDLEFCNRIQVIGSFIAAEGYDRYRAENLRLAKELVGSSDRATLFVTSSGFLAAHPDTDDYVEARQLLGTGYAITLLPSLDIELSTSIVVERQLARGFGFERDSEDRKFRHRFGIYRREGQMLVTSVDPPEVTAAAIHRRLAA